jgi:hypothetical protein
MCRERAALRGQDALHPRDLGLVAAGALGAGRGIGVHAGMLARSGRARIGAIRSHRVRSSP